LADLRALAHDALTRWHLTRDGPDQPTDDALLIPVRQGSTALMLKIISPDGDETGQADFLAALNGQGAVRLIAHHGPALLMDRLIPSGPTLTDMATSGQDAAAMTILCDVTHRLQQALRGKTLPLIPFDHRTAFLSTISGGTPADMALVRWGADLARTLSVGSWQPLHGDMHHLNVIHDQTHGWTAIDPKGILGPPAYDMANALLNPITAPHLTHDPARMAAMATLVARRFGVTPQRMLAFAALQGTLGLAWSLTDSEAPYWATCARIAGRLADLNPPG
jgi:streptomycin 6-kinase